LSTLALGGSEAAAGRPGVALRFPDLFLLALALPVFLLADLPLLGYAVAAAVWVAQHAVLALAQRSATAALRRQDRRRALAMMGASTLGRVWLVTLAILLVGVLGEREDGLAAAVLSFALVTVHLGSMAFARLLYPEEAR
jgi:L-asparagine transporter-like permease